MITTQIVTVETKAGCFTAYARTSNREHSATSTDSSLAVRLAATGLHQLQLVDVQSFERLNATTWKVSFRHGSVSRSENWAHVPGGEHAATAHGAFTRRALS